MVELALVKNRHLGGQGQRFPVEHRQGHADATAGQALKPATGATMAAVGYRRHAHSGVASASAVQQGDAAAHLFQGDLHMGAVWFCDARDGAVPPLANPLFHQRCSSRR